MRQRGSFQAQDIRQPFKGSFIISLKRGVQERVRLTCCIIKNRTEFDLDVRLPQGLPELLANVFALDSSAAKALGPLDQGR